MWNSISYNTPTRQPARHEATRDCNSVSDDRVPYRLDPAGPGQYKQRVHSMNTRFFAWRLVIAASFRGCAGLLTSRSGKGWAYGMPSCDLN